MRLEIFKHTFRLSWPYIAIILAHTTWGINFIVAKLALQEIPIFSLAFLRFVIAFLFLLPFLLTSKEKITPQKKDLPALTAMGVLMVTLNIALFYEGLNRTTAIDAAVLTMIIPILSVLGGWWFLKEKVLWINLAGILSGLLGAVLIIGVPLFFISWESGFSQLLGNILIILACLTWVMGAIISKKLLLHYSTLTITMIMFAIGIITFFIPALSEYLKNPDWLSNLTYLGLFALFYIAIASSVSAYFLFEWGLNKVGIIKADLFQYLEPLIATLLAILILGEHLDWTFLVGAVLIAFGVYAGTITKQFHKHHKAHRN